MAPPVYTISVHGADVIRFSRHFTGEHVWATIEFGHGNLINVFLPEEAREQLFMLQRLRDDVAETVEAVQKRIVEANHAALEKPGETVKLARCRHYPSHIDPTFCSAYQDERTGIVRDNARENAYFTRTQGWDPRGDGPDKEPEEVTAAQILWAIRKADPSSPVNVRQTGGNIATVFVGPADAEGSYKLSIGPGSYNWSQPWSSTFILDGLSIGHDDEGATESTFVDTLDDITAFVQKERELTRG